MALKHLKTLNEELPTIEVDADAFQNPYHKDPNFFKKGYKDGSVGDDIVKTKPVQIPANRLKPSQDAVYLGKALGLAIAGVAGGDLQAIISSDNRILDGHHRWAATILNNPKAKVGGVQAELKIGDLIQVLRQAGDALGNNRGLEPKGGDLNIFKANVKDVEECIFTGKNMNPEFYNREDAINWFNKVGSDNIQKALNQIQRVSPPTAAPPRADMPKIKPGQVDNVAKKLAGGALDVRAPYTAEAKKPGPDGYMTGLSDKDEEEKEKQMKKQGAMDDDDPSAYKEMPGDKEARKKGKVKKSKFTTAYHKKFKKNKMKNLQELDSFIDDIKSEKEAQRIEDIKNTKLNTKLKTIDEFTTESVEFAFDIFEGVMSDLHMLAGEAKDEDSFVKTFFKDYGDKIKKSKESEEWVRSLYKDTVQESVDEKNKGLWANIRAKRKRGEKPARKGSKAYKKAKAAADSINNEAFIGPFVFNNKMSDEELKDMYDAALDGYANYSRGFEHPKSKYKQAYQEIEKILKKRGVSIDEAVELVHVYKDGELYGTGELVKGKDKKIKGKRHQLIRFDGSTEDYYPAEDVKLVETVSEAKIARKKGKTYQTGKDWTVYMSSGQASFDINVNNSAGWSTDPSDDRGETLRLLDAGKERASITFKDGNIDKVAKEMHDLTDKTTYGEKNGLSPKDYADILRVWIDMGMEMHESLNEDYDKMLDRRYGRSRDYTDIEAKDMHFQTDADELEKMKLAYGYRLGGITDREKIEDAEYELRRYRKTIKYGNGKDVGVFLPGSYAAATSTLGDGPHKSTRPKVKWNQRKYDQWIEDVASNDGWKHAADMAQNANNEPGLIDWVKRNNRGDDPLQRIQWDIEAMAESKENNMKKLQTLEYFVTEKKKQTNDQSPLSDDGMETGIKNKAKESGVPVGLLRIIMKRGLAAWKSGHRPGATQAQWGYARVNSFLTKQDGTWGGADSDIAKKVRDGGHDKKL